ncbi:MAG TPA: helix-turn-helix domain-containing protein [Kiritimatiellia bacterium]|nr:helix-turn-helix domain-containing protein [Kiritimatiellia bacterium]HMO99657.1 helix-turn-helix domain-containing protein [Kiritimatiellia bacterium]HMP96169.1 helix-turn-helix domain-containing protein [Kiritimatiellia bacterium]
METMGQRFRAARERKRIPISRAAALTRIKVQHLEAMERDDFSQMPAPTYAKGFIRMYADFLGLDSAPLVQEYLDVHLEAAEEKPRRRPATTALPPPDIPDEDTPERSPPRKPAKPRDAAWATSARKLADGLIKRLPLLVALLIGLAALVGMVRCAARMGAPAAEPAGTGERLDPQMIMKEPPVRYLDLPVLDEDTP